MADDKLNRMQAKLGKNPMGFGKQPFTWAELTAPVATSPTMQWEPDSSQCAIVIDVKWDEYISTSGPTTLVSRMLGFSQRVPGKPIGEGIVAATWVAGVVTFTMQAPHGLSVGSIVTVKGVIPDTYDGVYTVALVPSPTTFTVTLLVNPGAYASDGEVVGPDRLHREVPWRCPYVPWMWAKSVGNVTGLKFTGKISDGISAPRQQYNRARMTVTFTTLPYRVLTDDQLYGVKYGGDESQRYVEKPWKTTAEYISIDRGFFRFKEGRPGPPNGPQNLGRKFPLGTGKISVKSDLDWTWHNVAENYIFNSLGIPRKIIDGLGCVNDRDYLGFRKGTLLALPPEFTPVTQPVPPFVLGLTNDDPPRSWNVRFLFKYWDPPIGVKGTGGVAPTTHGHNTALWVDDALFYAIKSETGGFLFQEYDFRKFFQAVDL